ncbi:MAG: ribonuclease Y [Candidatus Margulisiibacteriota bacterium]
MNTLIILLGTVAIVSAVAVFLYKRYQSNQLISNAKHEAGRLVTDADRQSKDILSKADKEAQRLVAQTKRNIEEESRKRQEAARQFENRLMQKEKHIDEREGHITQREAQLEEEHEKVKAIKKKEEAFVNELLFALEKLAGFTREEAEKTLFKLVERDARQRAGKMIKEMEDQARKIANRKAKEIVTDAIQRTAVNHIVPATTSAVHLPDDEMKGRIIGREGRNIRAFEAVTGVDIIIDDTPGTVILSCFDPIRREVARLTLEKLVQDGRIHPARIEEAVEKSKEELHQTVIERGEAAADEVGLQFHPKMIELLGKLYYRTSYGQNVLAHALEAAHIAGIMAEQLGVNVSLAKRGALLHDIGKALDFDHAGTHTQLGEEVCRKYGESEEVINCINAHHEDEEPDTIEAILVTVADALSSSRPGARRESVETYIKRIEKLEKTAKSFEGVDTAYAIQAGREIRVMVRPDVVDDPGAHKLAMDIAKKIETEMDYPGEVKVSVIRETRAVSTAH